MPTKAIVSTVENLFTEEKAFGVIDNENHEFVFYDQTELDDLILALETRPVSTRDHAKELGIRVNQLLQIVGTLLSKNRIRGFFTSGGLFLADQLVKKLFVGEFSKIEEISIAEISAKLLIDQEGVKCLVAILEDRVIEKLIGVSLARVSDIAEETGLPENLVVALLKRALVKETINGSLDMVDRVVRIERISERETAQITRTKNRKATTPSQGTTQHTRIALGIILLFVIVAIVGAGIWWISFRNVPGMSQATFTFVVESNTDWSGTFGTIEEGHRTESGFGGRSFIFHGSLASAAVQKMTEEGYLSVRILKDGQVVVSQSTTTFYGVVSISASS